MFNFIKRWKAIYVLYNLFHRKQLVHNLPLYEKYGLKKNYFDPISSRDFQGLSQEINSSQPIPENLPTHLSVDDAEAIKNFHGEGYAILRNFFSEEKTEAANAIIASMLSSGQATFTNGNKIMFAVRKSDELKAMATDPLLLSVLESLLRSKPLLFQSINFLKGSEQEVHSDSIHMTTFPLGKLIAVWIALEDVDESNGPLVFYPGSHLLPYYLNADYGNEGNAWMIGPKDYEEYEMMARKKIAESGLQPKTFIAKKGDILIWHANLFHGGAHQTDRSRTRKSMVLHYFGDDAICYHEITQRPALMDVELSSAPI